MIDPNILKDAGSAVLCWLATTDKRGCPSVSPKELWSLDASGKLVVADIASGGSVRNIQLVPEVCVSFIDIFRQKGSKLYGRAKIVPRDAPDFEALGREVLDAAGDAFPVRNLIVVNVQRSAPIRAPSYHLHPERTEEDMRKLAYATYGVSPSLWAP